MSARVRPDAPIPGLNNLLLQAILAKAETETVKPADQAFDKNAVFARRRRGPGIDQARRQD